MTVPTDEFVAITRRTQELATSAAKTWADTARQYSEQVSFENPLPGPAAVHTAVDAWFDLAAGLVTEQRTLVKTLVDAGTAAAGIVTEQARAAAASVPANPFAPAAETTDEADATTAKRRARTTS